VRDRALALDWGIKGLAAELSRRHVETIDLRGSFETANAETRVEVSFGGAFELERRRLGLELELADAELGQIARLHSTLASLAHLDLSLAARARLTLDVDDLVVDPIEIRLTGERAPAPAVVRGDARWAAATKTLSAAASTVGFDLSLLAPLSATLAERLAAAPPVPALDADIDIEASPQRRRLHATVRASTDEAPFSTLIATLEHVPGQGPSDIAIEIETLRPWRLARFDARLAHLRGVEVALGGTVRGSVSADALALAVSLAGHQGQLQIAGIPTAPLAIEHLEIEAEVAGTAAAPRLDRAELRAGAGTITAAAHVRPSKRGYAATAEVATPQLERADLDRFWPADLAPGARSQVAKAFVAGVLRDVLVAAEIAIDAKADPAVSLEALDGAATLDRVELDVLAPQPPLIVEGRARLDLDGLSATVDRAILRDLELSPGTVRLSGWRGGGLALNVETRWRGPLQSVLSTITGEPWPLIKHAQNFADATASTAGDLLVDARLGESAQSQPPQLRVRARVEGLEWHSGLLDLPISRGNLGFTFSDGAIGVEGDLVLGSSPVHVTLRHRVDDVEPRDSVRVEGRIDPATARSLGLPERRFLDGSVGVAASYTRNHDGVAEVQAQLDLTAAALELAEAGIAKRVGEKASALMEARVDPAGTLDVRSLVVDAPEVQGSARLSATTEPFRLESATVERLSIRESELTGTVRRRGDGGFSVTVDAKRLDLRSLLADEADDAAAEDVAAKATDGSGALNTQFDFEGSAGTLLLLHDVETERFAAKGSWNGERWDRLSIHGSFDDATKVALDYDRADTTGGLTLSANDLGRIWRALASKSEIEGGALRLTGAAGPAGQGLLGRGELRSFTVIQMPVFASILRLGTLDSLVGMFESKGLEFKLAEADLAWDGRRLSVANGRAVGGGIALTGEGSFDLHSGTLDFAGTVAHMGRFSRLVAHIPLINTLVLGRDRAGVIATRFHLTGAIADPEIQVQPLSTFSPGFLRDVFGAGRRGLSPKAKPKGP
ncbi:MAG TPA: AsmA-like C-terminal domain-containing protein, partial [Thermoanaerobaculia bacterium]|nr:AsmA-like C-terminal domain-containing protein [Thermoanaerobaculia bacterium]